MFTPVGSKQRAKVVVGRFASSSSSSGAQASSDDVSNAWTDAIKRQPFTQKCEIFFPVGDLNIGYKLAPIMEPSYKHFYGLKASPMAFTSDSFKQLKASSKSDFYALTSMRRFDMEDVFAVYPSEELVLSLQKDTFVSTGLSKSNQHTFHNSETLSPKTLEITPSIIVIKLDSEKPSRQVDFVRDADILGATPFYLQFESRDGTAPPRSEVETSLRDHFGDKLGRFLINSERQTLRGLQVPVILMENLIQSSPTSIGLKRENEPRSLKQETSISGADDGHSSQYINGDYVDDLLEWIGAMHCRARSYVEGQPIDAEISTMTADALERAPMHGLTFRHEGFLIPSWIEHQVKQAKSIVDAGMAPYAIVTSWAFVDQPLQSVHYFRDSHITLVIFPDNLYLLSGPML